MATLFEHLVPRAAPARTVRAQLADPARAITNPRFDALFYWGAPAIAFLFVWSWVLLTARLPGGAPQVGKGMLAIGIAVLTYAHLIAVVPRAYFNRDVFETHRFRLTVIPVALIAALIISAPLLVLATVVAIFWDVHHSAMQTFGLARIYDMKAGNPPVALRRTDLWMNWAMYVGPLAAGGSLMFHVRRFGDLSALDWTWFTGIPSLAVADAGAIRLVGLALWLVCVGGAVLNYRRAHAQGYRMPAQKMALLGISATVSIAAWVLSPPYIAFASINLFHAAQYFAIVWTKEGGRMRALAGVSGRTMLELFLLACAAFGLAYYAAASAHLLLAPFIACSLLHFWFDGFIWSVRRRQV